MVTERLKNMGYSVWRFDWGIGRVYYSYKILWVYLFSCGGTLTRANSTKNTTFSSLRLRKLASFDIGKRGKCGNHGGVSVDEDFR
jgi:hypothetical protein